MYNKIRYISDTKFGFSANKNSFFVPKKEKGFILYDFTQNNLQEYNTDYDVSEILILSDEKIIVTESRARIGSLFTIQNNKISLLKALPYYSVISVKNDFLQIRVVEEIENFKAQWYPAPALYNWQIDEIVWQAPYDLFFIDDYIFGRRFNAPYRLSPTTGEVLWSYSFEGYAKTKNIHRVEKNVMLHNSDKAFTGVINNQLWVTLNTWQHLVLDINTGEQIALLGNRYNYNKPYEGQHLAGGGCIDKKNNKIVSLVNAVYREIDCSTFEITFIDLREEFEQHDVNSIGDIIIDDDYLYFYDKKFMGVNQCCKVAVLDRKTLKVVWAYDFAQHGTFPMQMEKTERHLFVLDGSSTLHIFEKETAPPA